MQTKYCPKCGTLNRANARFCAKCGTPLEVKDNQEQSKPIAKTSNKRQLTWIILATILILVLLGGILTWIIHSRSTSTSVQKNMTSSKTTTDQSTNYDKLSSVDQKKVHFKFTLSQDDTKDTTADPVYVVSMTATNKSDKTIKFYKNKFVYLLPVSKIVSSKSGVLIIKPGKTVTIDQLFENIPEQGTVGSGIIEYLNKDHKLAYANFVNNVATSANLNDSSLASENSSVTGAEDTDEISGDTETTNDDYEASYNDTDNHPASSSSQSSSSAKVASSFSIASNAARVSSESTQTSVSSSTNNN